jgi:hypothetical protein
LFTHIPVRIVRREIVAKDVEHIRYNIRGVMVTMVTVFIPICDRVPGDAQKKTIKLGLLFFLSLFLFTNAIFMKLSCFLVTEYKHNFILSFILLNNVLLSIGEK